MDQSSYHSRMTPNYEMTSILAVLSILERHRKPQQSLNFIDYEQGAEREWRRVRDSNPR